LYKFLKVIASIQQLECQGGTIDNADRVRLNKKIEKWIIRHHWVVAEKPPFPNIVEPLKVAMMDTAKYYSIV